MHVTQDEESGLIKLLTEIETLQNDKPDGRKKKEYNQWKEDIETKMKEYNTLSGHRSFPDKID